MKKETRLKLVLTILHIFGWGWLLMCGILFFGMPPGILLFGMPPTGDDTARDIGQIFGFLFIGAPGFAAIYWAFWKPKKTS